MQRAKLHVYHEEIIMHLRDTLQRLVACDLACTAWANRINGQPCLSTLFGLVSRLGNGAFWYSLIPGLLLLYGRPALPGLLHMTATGLLASAVYKCLKTRSGRPRPYLRLPRLRLTQPPLDAFSFPSGHTLHAVCFTCVASHYWPEMGAPLAIFTTLIAISRLILGLHYLSDVVAGAALGLLVAQLSLYAGA